MTHRVMSMAGALCWYLAMAAPARAQRQPAAPANPGGASPTSVGITVGSAPPTGPVESLQITTSPAVGVVPGSQVSITIQLPSTVLEATEAAGLATDAASAVEHLRRQIRAGALPGEGALWMRALQRVIRGLSSDERRTLYYWARSLERSRAAP